MPFKYYIAHSIPELSFTTSKSHKAIWTLEQWNLKCENKRVNSPSGSIQCLAKGIKAKTPPTFFLMCFQVGNFYDTFQYDSISNRRDTYSTMQTKLLNRN